MICRGFANTACEMIHEVSDAQSNLEMLRHGVTRSRIAFRNFSCSAVVREPHAAAVADARPGSGNACPVELFHCRQALSEVLAVHSANGVSGPLLQPQDHGQESGGDFHVLASPDHGSRSVIAVTAAIFVGVRWGVQIPGRIENDAGKKASFRGSNLSAHALAVFGQ